MKKLILSLTVLAASLTAVAQQFVIVDGQVKEYPFLQGQQVFLADEIESISYRIDPDFILMPAALASDEHTQLFSQALQLTGLADSLQTYFDYEYYCQDYLNKEGMYYIANHYQYAKVLDLRYIKFTAFVETDEVLAVNGIKSMADLTAYAKRIYDDVFPEDAAVSDPTDRRNSLNRFVAYHILPFGASGSTLTAFPNWFDQSLADVADWYQTMMPEGSLKVSRPRTGNASNTEIGLFLNRRGLQDGPDKYGVQVRGIKIGEAVNTQNGFYFYIDSPLVYDRKTQEETMQERWRVDFVTLSSDFITARTRENQAGNISPDTPEKPATYFIPQYTNGISFNHDADVIIAPSRYYYWSYGGDQVDVCSDVGHNDITIDLPCLPEGDWELRLGTCMIPSCPIVQATIDDDSQLTTSLNLACPISLLETMGWSSYASSETYADILQQRAKIDELLLTLPTYKAYPSRYQERNGVLGIYEAGIWTPLSEELLANEEFQAFLKSVATEYRSAADIKQLINEKVMVRIDDTHIKDMLTGITYEEVEELPDYTEMFTRELFRLNGFLPGPAECRIEYVGNNTSFNDTWSQGNSNAMSTVSSLSRHIIGRFHSDGRTRRKLNIKSIYADGGSYLDLDYLEFCPVSIADHPTIPED